MKTLLSLSALATAALLAAGAGCDKHAVVDPPQPQPNKWTVFTNATDPELARVVTPTNDTVRFFGDRNDDGSPLALRSIVHETSSGLTSRAQFGADGSLKRFVDGNGTVMAFTPLGSGRVLVTLTTADGLNTLQTVAGPEQAKASPLLDPRRSSAGRPRQGARVHPTSPLSAPPQEKSLEKVVGSQVQVQVSRCAAPVEADQYDVWVRVLDLGNGVPVGNFPLSYLGGGRYATTIPAGQTYWESAQSNCQGIAGILSLSCDALLALGPGGETQLCVSIAAAISSLGISAPAATWFLAACEGLIGVQMLYCAVVSPPSDAGSGMPDLATQLCDAFFDDRLLESNLEITPYITALPDHIVGSSVVVPANFTPPLQLGLEVGDQTHIESLVLDPSAPMENEAYIATATVNCVPLASIVSMNIVGTDGYSDGWTEMTSSNYDRTTYSLWVPGAEAGVRDEVTIAVTPSGDGAPVRLNAWLVFGGL